MPPEKRREQLIDAALTVILEQGYEGVSIEAVARTAGVTRPVVYDHYPNLAQLLQALIEREERYALAQLDEVVPDDPGEPSPAGRRRGGSSCSRSRARRRSSATTSRPIALARSSGSSGSCGGPWTEPRLRASSTSS
jgi:AcrR family transcriptional regulator